MENVINIRGKVEIDFDELVESDLVNGIRLAIVADTTFLCDYYNIKKTMEEDTIFTLFIETMKSKKEDEKSMFIDIPIDELELFAHSILKQIDIVRNNYSTQIKYQTEKGVSV